MDDTTLNMWLINVGTKVLMTMIAYHFYTIGNMFLAGLFMGWIVAEIIVLLAILTAMIGSILRR